MRLEPATESDRGGPCAAQHVLPRSRASATRRCDAPLMLGLSQQVRLMESGEVLCADGIGHGGVPPVRTRAGYNRAGARVAIAAPLMTPATEGDQALVTVWRGREGDSTQNPSKRPQHDPEECQEIDVRGMKGGHAVCYYGT